MGTRTLSARLASAALVGALGLVLGCSPGPEAETAAPTGDPVAARLRLAGTPVPGFPERPDFVLTDTEGRRFDFRAETGGELTLLFFGYTSCPDICPVHLANLAAALDRISPDVGRALEVVFVGVDPARDTPERMREWLDHFDPRFVGLTGTPEELEAAQRAAGVPLAFADGEGEGYAVSHAGWITLYDRSDRARLRYPFGTRQKQWAHDLAVLAREGWPAG